MGQKVNPNIFRIERKGWDSVFYADRNYSKFLIEDLKIRAFIKVQYALAQVSKVIISRTSDKDLDINIYARRIGILIGKGGADLDRLKKKLQEKYTKTNVSIKVSEIAKPDLEASLVAQQMALQIKKRVSFKRVMKTAIQSCMKQGKAQGIKVSCSGRLGGAEIARTEVDREGRVPLHTIRADIDYACAEAITTYGVIGIKVWIFKGDYIEAPRKI